MFVAHDLESGCATVPEIGRMYGGKGDSEALLAERIVKRLPQASIVMADAGLGGFSRGPPRPGVWPRHSFSFVSLPIQIPGQESHARSRALEKQNVEIEVEADRYRHRYDVETDIKAIKVAMNAVTGLPPRRLSFQGVCDTYKIFLANYLDGDDISACVDRFEQALQIASQEVIPHRPGRNDKRAAHSRRPKTTKWQNGRAKRSTPIPLKNRRFPKVNANSPLALVFLHVS